MSVKTSAPAATAGANLAVLLALAHATNDAFANVLPVYLPLFQARFGLGEAALAGFVALISVSSNVLQAFAGALADRWGRRRTAALGLVVGSTLMSFLAIVPSVAALFLVLALGGLGSAAFHPAAASMARAAGRRKGLAMGFFTAGGPLGTAAMPVVVLFVIREFGIGYVPLLAVVGVVLGVLLFVLAPVQERPPAQSRPRVFDPALFAGPVGALAVAGILRAIAFISFTNAMPLFLVNVRGFAPDAPAIGWTLASYSGAAALGVLVSGALEARLGRVRLIVGSMLAAIPLLVATLVVPPATPLFFLMVAAAGAATNAAIPLLVISAQNLAPNAVATASGMLMGFTWGIAGVLYVGFGALQEWIGIGPALAASFLFPAPAALLAFRTLRRHRDALA